MLTLVKFGGSLITDKTTAYSLRLETIVRLIEEVKQSLVADQKLQLVLANGAGSFAHQSAALYGTESGFSDDLGRFGYCAVQHDAGRLNNMVVGVCIEKGLPVVSMQPSVMIRSSNKLAEYVDFSSVCAAVDAGITPFLYGDALLDSVIGSTIYSTDKVLHHLVAYVQEKTEMTVARIIHVGDYDGVLDDSGDVIPEITQKTYHFVEKHLHATSVVDVTGGMRDKVEEMLAVAKRGVSSYIISGAKEGNLAACLLKKPFVGTKIY
tara:strand:+ start:388 stop:1182 length:795 start_codon:yes stop_codon:yes gene_type:complete